MKLFFAVLLLVFIGIIGCNNTSVAESETPEIIEKLDTPIFHLSHEPKKQGAPFSDVVQVGNTFYLAGQIGMDHRTRQLVEGGIQAETRQTLENIKAVLGQHGLSMADVVKAQVILDTIEDFAAFNEIYVTYFPQKPARTTFAAEALARGAKIEIEVIAVKN